MYVCVCVCEFYWYQSDCHLQVFFANCLGYYTFGINCFAGCGSLEFSTNTLAFQKQKIYEVACNLHYTFPALMLNIMTFDCFHLVYYLQEFSPQLVIIKLVCFSPTAFDILLCCLCKFCNKTREPFNVLALYLYTK